MRRNQSTADVAQTLAIGRVAAVLAAAIVLIFAPGIAQASFSSFARDSLPASSATIPTSTATVSANCSGSNLTIAVTSWAIPDPRLVGVFTVTPTDGTTPYTGTSNQSGGGTYTAKIPPHTGTWKWTVQNQYRVPGTSNVWSGETKSGQFTCT